MSDINLQDKAWYIATTYAGHENKAASNLKARIETMNLSDSVFRVIVAEEEIEEVVNGKTKTKIINLYPGYIFVEMIMTDESWYNVRNTPEITGLAGSSGGGTKPTPIPSSEIESVLKRIGQVDEEMLSKYVVGERVRVVSGTFNNMEGVITKIDNETKLVTINTMFFGRSTPLEVEFAIIEKI